MVLEMKLIKKGVKMEIKLWLDTGFIDCEYIDYIEMPSGTSEEDLNELAREFMEDNINYGFEIVKDAENET